ncbi:hypothetical protein SAMN05216522_102350 [Rosenbergiella nectarea]|uniref:Uncharacterized protein n=1 Tax=Rosenbergiella nectarea TaxID=988801 RepID=A0A1H9FK67_9GAMM|nr:hypothetical protein SAMN05216522_102350 [Rosenbergiella nectarea]
MPWIYQQSSGRLYHIQQFIVGGYSGFPPQKISAISTAKHC